MSKSFSNICAFAGSPDSVSPIIWGTATNGISPGADEISITFSDAPIDRIVALHAVPSRSGTHL